MSVTRYNALKQWAEEFPTSITITRIETRPDAVHSDGESYKLELRFDNSEGVVIYYSQAYGIIGPPDIEAILGSVASDLHCLEQVPDLGELPEEFGDMWTVPAYESIKRQRDQIEAATGAYGLRRLIACDYAEED